MSLKISRVLHAGFLFQYQGVKIIFDPIFENPFSRNCYAYPSVNFDQDTIRSEKFDAVIISHFHDDHCSMESLALINRSTPIYMFCVHEEMFELIRKLGFTQVYPLQLDQTLRIGDIEVTPLRAVDENVDSLFHIKAAGKNILNVVDSWTHLETLKYLSHYEWDLVLWPFQTMRELEVLCPSRSEPSSRQIPGELADQLRALNPNGVVPSSCQFIHEPWSWYNYSFFPISYAGFQTQVKDLLPRSQVIRMDPGVTVDFIAGQIVYGERLPWISLLESGEVDYDYRPQDVVPPTAEISKNFPALGKIELDELTQFCKDEIPAKYRACYDEDEASGYFQKKRYWKLSVFDHLGNEVAFHYEVFGDLMICVPESNLPLGWHTEIPIFKLQAAINSGEALTSLYLRINDQFFSDEIEKEVADIDLFEDPLVRILYFGSFAGYQKSQLRKLLQ